MNIPTNELFPEENQNNSSGMSFSDLLRPKTLSDVSGQDHILGEGAILNKILRNGTFDSLILVGPPGTGKTTIAKIIGDILGMPFYSLHATTAGAQDLKKIADVAMMRGKPVLVFIDEIHRYNKSQQNLLLKMIDDKFVKMVGASTENPTYTLTPAFRSRSIILKLNKLTDADLKQLALKSLPLIAKRYDVDEVLPGTALDEIIREAGGDARRFINLLELTSMLGERNDRSLTLSTDGLEQVVRKKNFDDDEYYDILSAMIKSIRGSDPDAALLWAFKLVKSGVEPEAVFRRLMISASEDVGNAYPDALNFVSNAYNAFMNVGFPEGHIILSHAVLYLASCPKSNACYMAYKKITEYLEEKDPQVPSHIGNAAVGYKYPFDYGGFVKQQYRPSDAVFYEPSDNGFEAKITERLKRLWS